MLILYANVRPAQATAGVRTPFPRVDLVVIRENTEDLYTGEERLVGEDTVEATRRITRGASARIAQFAFAFAAQNGRTTVTAAHKANVLKQRDGLFLAECRRAAAEYLQLRYEEQLGDSLLTRLVQAPEQLDVILCPNMLGDLVSDLAAGLVGGLGLCPSANIGEGYALFEPCHGSAPDIAGQGVANPTSQVRCGIMLLEHLGEHAAASRIRSALGAVLMEGKHVTLDLGGCSFTMAMAREIVARGPFRWIGER